MDANYYINWVLYAVVGLMREADDIMKQYGPQVRSVAKQFRRQFGVPRRTLYRGLLLSPDEAGGLLQQDQQVTFVSFSEDYDVACWFADPASVVSGGVKAHRPDVVGWIVEHRPQKADVLFHHEWYRSLFEEAAQMHPYIDHNQFIWNLRVQSEVILSPLSSSLELAAHEAAPCPDTAKLDRRFVPPWLR